MGTFEDLGKGKAINKHHHDGKVHDNSEGVHWRNIFFLEKAAHFPNARPLEPVMTKETAVVY